MAQVDWLSQGIKEIKIIDTNKYLNIYSGIYIKLIQSQKYTNKLIFTTDEYTIKSHMLLYITYLLH